MSNDLYPTMDDELTYKYLYNKAKLIVKSKVSSFNREKRIRLLELKLHIIEDTIDINIISENEFTEWERAQCARLERDRETAYLEIQRMLYKYRLSEAGTARNVYKDSNYIGQLFLEWVDKSVDVKVLKPYDRNEIKYILEKNGFVVTIDKYR